MDRSLTGSWSKVERVKYSMIQCLIEQSSTYSRLYELTLSNVKNNNQDEDCLIETSDNVDMALKNDSISRNMFQKILNEIANYTKPSLKNCGMYTIKPKYLFEFDPYYFKTAKRLQNAETNYKKLKLDFSLNIQANEKDIYPSPLRHICPISDRFSPIYYIYMCEDFIQQLYFVLHFNFLCLINQKNFCDDEDDRLESAKDNINIGQAAMFWQPVVEQCLRIIAYAIQEILLGNISNIIVIKFLKLIQVKRKFEDSILNSKIMFRDINPYLYNITNKSSQPNTALSLLDLLVQTVLQNVWIKNFQKTSQKHFLSTILLSDELFDLVIQILKSLASLKFPECDLCVYKFEPENLIVINNLINKENCGNAFLSAVKNFQMDFMHTNESLTLINLLHIIENNQLCNFLFTDNSKTKSSQQLNFGVLVNDASTNINENTNFTSLNKGKLQGSINRDQNVDEGKQLIRKKRIERARAKILKKFAIQTRIFNDKNNTDEHISEKQKQEDNKGVNNRNFSSCALKDRVCIYCYSHLKNDEMVEKTQSLNKASIVQYNKTMKLFLFCDHSAFIDSLQRPPFEFTLHSQRKLIKPKRDDIIFQFCGHSIHYQCFHESNTGLNDNADSIKRRIWNPLHNFTHKIDFCAFCRNPFNFQMPIITDYQIIKMLSHDSFKDLFISLLTSKKFSTTLNSNSFNSIFSKIKFFNSFSEKIFNFEEEKTIIEFLQAKDFVKHLKKFGRSLRKWQQLKNLNKEFLSLSDDIDINDLEFYSINGRDFYGSILFRTFQAREASFRLLNNDEEVKRRLTNRDLPDLQCAIRTLRYLIMSNRKYFQSCLNASQTSIALLLSTDEQLPLFYDLNSFSEIFGTFLTNPNTNEYIEVKKIDYKNEIAFKILKRRQANYANYLISCQNLFPILLKCFMIDIEVEHKWFKKANQFFETKSQEICDDSKPHFFNNSLDLILNFLQVIHCARLALGFMSTILNLHFQTNDGNIQKQKYAFYSVLPSSFVDLIFSSKIFSNFILDNFDFFKLKNENVDIINSKQFLEQISLYSLEFLRLSILLLAVNELNSSLDSSIDIISQRFSSYIGYTNTDSIIEQYEKMLKFLNLPSFYSVLSNYYHLEIIKKIFSHLSFHEVEKQNSGLKDVAICNNDKKIINYHHLIFPSYSGFNFHISDEKILLPYTFTTKVINQFVAPSLVKLPEKFDILFMLTHKFICHESKCNYVSQKLALCLFCGELLTQCNFNQEKYSQWRRMLIDHNKNCSFCVGGIYFLVKENNIVFVYNDILINHESPYLDEHGESDPFLKRGNSLYLNEVRWDKLNRLAVNYQICSDVYRNFQYNNRSFEQ